MPEPREVSAPAAPFRRPAGRFVLLLGRIVALASVLWIGRILWDFDPSSITTRLDRFAATVAIGALTYATASLCLLEAWVRWLRLLGSHHPSRRHLYVVYGQTQLARYIPGNVVQLASRHLLAARLGVGHSQLLGAMFGEILGLLAAASLIVATVLGWTALEPPLAGQTLWMVAIAAALGTGACIALPRTDIGARLGLQPLSLFRLAVQILVLLLLYCVFFILGGLILFATATAVTSPPLPSTALRLVVAFAASWMVGFLTPGAPAGVGVRELALLSLLSPLLSPSAALTTSLSLRLTTILGDLLLYVGSQVLRR